MGLKVLGLCPMFENEIGRARLGVGGCSPSGIYVRVQYACVGAIAQVVLEITRLCNMQCLARSLV